MHSHLHDIFDHRPLIHPDVGVSHDCALIIGVESSSTKMMMMERKFVLLRRVMRFSATTINVDNFEKAQPACIQT